MKNRKHIAGFSTVELLISIVIMGVMVAAAVVEMEPRIQQIHANSGVSLIEGQMRLARQMSIAERRDIRVQFIGTNEVKVTRQEVPAGTTVLSDVFLPPTVNFVTFAGNGDTPDGFGVANPVEFGGIAGGPPIMQFQSDGSFIDGNGNQLNGTVFIGVVNIPTSARAVTILGATGRVRMYRGNGSGWLAQ